MSVGWECQVLASDVLFCASLVHSVLQFDGKYGLSSTIAAAMLCMLQYYPGQFFQVMVVRVKVLTDFLGICSEEVLQAVAAGVDLFDSTYPSILQGNLT